jgi:glycosyltransferase involved in cell wall biosynthesis
MADAPLVSFVIPSYNMGSFLERAVESALNQSYPRIEVIVVDDGSTDDTAERMRRFDGRIRYIHKENGGVCSARNIGIRASSGEYVALMDSDDRSLPGKIERSMQYFRDHPECGLIHSDAELIDGNDNIVGMDLHPWRVFTGPVVTRLIMVNFICNPTVIVKKTCFEKAGLFDETLFPPADWDMWLRIAEHFSVGYIPEALSQYRVTSNSCFNDLERMKRESEQVIASFFKRNPDVDPAVRAKAWSQFHLSMAKCQFLKNNKSAMNAELTMSRRYTPVSFNMWAFRLGCVLCPSLVRRRLERKILRKYL